MDSIPTPSTSSIPPATSTSTLTPALFRRLHPKAYLDKFLAEGVRPDGRLLKSSASGGQGECWREASANIGSISTAPSSSLIRLGNTTVVCGITLEIAPPEISSPNCGFLVPNVDLSPLCSSLFRAGPPPDEAQVLSTRLRDILLSSNISPLESLIIEPSKAAFVVYLDVVCLSYDGGVLDAAVLACASALQNLVLPQANYDIDTGKTTCITVTETTPGRVLPLGPAPICTSFGLVNGHLLPDPTLFESDLCTSNITIVLLSSSSPESSSPSDLLHIYQAGAPLSINRKEDTDGQSETGRQVLKMCVEMARERGRELSDLLQEE